MDEPILRIEGLTAGYGRRPVIRDARLEVRRGEFWFLVGPNGSGKTTLLRAILGDLAPRAGRIRRHPEFVRPERVGFVPQRCDIHPTLPITVREFVLLGAVGSGLRKDERKSALTRALERVDLAGFERKDYWSLSGGQRQRALVARALVRRPGLLIADEPTSGLDISAGETLLRAIEVLNREERLTILFVTHDLALASRHGTHAALFHDGTVTAGLGREVLSPENLRRAYGIPVELARAAAGEPGRHLEGTGEEP